MFIESCLTAIINAVIRSSLAKVALYDIYALLYETANLLLIPLHRLGVAEVEHSILIGHSSIGIFYMHSAVNQFTEIAVLRSEIRQLPQTCMESHIVHILKHFHRILKAIL